MLADHTWSKRRWVRAYHGSSFDLEHAGVSNCKGTKDEAGEGGRAIQNKSTKTIKKKKREKKRKNTSNKHSPKTTNRRNKKQHTATLTRALAPCTPPPFFFYCHCELYYREVRGACQTSYKKGTHYDTKPTHIPSTLGRCPCRQMLSQTPSAATGRHRSTRQRLGWF